MKNKKLLYIGLGVVALVGLYFIFRPSGDTQTNTSEGKSTDSSGSGESGGTSSGSGESGGNISEGSGSVIAPSSSPSAKERRQNRRNCNREARGIYGRMPLRKKDREAKQKYKADCYKNGGFDDGTGE